jgi:hypothetical protein
LHVNSGDIGFEYGRAIKVATSGGSFTTWATNNTGTHTLLDVGWSNNTGAGDVVKFYTPGSQSASSRMILTSAGNVGINTETMIDTRNNGGIHIRDNRGISFAAGTHSNSRHWRIRTDDYADHGSLQFGVSGNNSTPPDASGEAVMTMTRDRNVGIGYAYPTAPLEIWSGRNADTWSKGQSYFNVLHNANNGYGMSFAVSASHGDGIIQTYNVSSGNAQYDLRLQPSGGNVGIGTNNPIGTLHINTATNGEIIVGDLRSSEATAPVCIRDYGSNQIHFYYGYSKVGSITSDSSYTYYNTSSDYRLKENVIPLVSALEKVNDLHVYRFNFITDTERTVHGFFAHEVQSVVPEAITGVKDATEDIGVITNIEDGKTIKSDVTEPTKLKEGTEWTYTGSRPVYQSIDQSKLVPLLTRCIQELSAKNDALETKLQEAEAKTTTLETKLQEAEAKIVTLQAEKEAIRSDLSSLVLRVAALES